MNKNGKFSDARDKEEEIARLIKIINVYEKFGKLCHEELLDAQTTIETYKQELLKLQQEIEQTKQKNFVLDELQSILQDSQALPIVTSTKTQQQDHQKRESGFYSDIFYIIANLELSEEEAEYHWKKILEHADFMSQQLNRSVGFRVAMLDYFLQNKVLMKNPKIIEFELFEEVIKSSIIDELTGIYNRRYFNDSLFREIKRCSRYNKSLSLFVFDLDNFKLFNDTYGHAVGDKALQVVARVLLENFRTEDIVARIGGEEFCAILPEIKPQDAFIPCKRFADRLKEESIKILPNLLTISGGIAHYPLDGKTPEELYIAADGYSYIAKKEGKDKIIVTKNI